MNLPLMSPSALDNAVHELIVRELGIANAMRFIARHNQPDGVDYTENRNIWLPQDPSAIELLHNEPNHEFERLVAESRKKKGRSSRSKAGERKQT